MYASFWQESCEGKTFDGGRVSGQNTCHLGMYETEKRRLEATGLWSAKADNLQVCVHNMQ